MRGFSLVFLTASSVSFFESLKLQPRLQSRSSRSFLNRRYRRFDVQEERSRQQPSQRLFDLSGLPTVSTLPLRETTPIKDTKSEVVVRTAHDLRRKVLDENMELKSIDIELAPDGATVNDLIHHEVVKLMVERFKSNSKPGHRAKGDTAHLSLSMEGGGMRGAVSAGMAAAIACLGLSDTFDSIYGSSAGSVIGSYMVSRQMCLDVYVDILPAAKQTFVCVKRMLSALAVSAVDYAMMRLQYNLPKFATRAMPGMNISFVLDGIMDETNGIRPLDMERFRLNDKVQPLRVAASYVRNGKLRTRCFGSNDFFGEDDGVKRTDGKRSGLFACLEASMTVPGATGPPVQIRDQRTNETISYFDAFCFEPLPYRSAVEHGATHVLVLCSRPEGFQPQSKPGFYERVVAPIYFRSHGEPEVANFFERGGQQYIYAEDLLTLAEGKITGIGKKSLSGVKVPPPAILYGVEHDEKSLHLASQRSGWKSAHLLPLKVPLGTPELHTLEQGKFEVLEAVRGGFAAAFDLLAPAIGLKLGKLTGKDVAELVFPEGLEDDSLLLQTQLRVAGDSILSDVEQDGLQGLKRRRIRRLLLALRWRLRRSSQTKQNISTENDSTLVLNLLPGLQSGKMSHLAKGLSSRANAVNLTAW